MLFEALHRSGLVAKGGLIDAHPTFGLLLDRSVA